MVNFIYQLFVSHNDAAQRVGAIHVLKIVGVLLIVFVGEIGAEAIGGLPGH